MTSVESATSGIAVADARDEVAELGDRVAARHAREDGVGARLHREVQLRRDGGHVAHDGDQLRRDVGGMRRGEANARETRNVGGSAQELGEVAVAVAIGVHGLPEEHDLARAVATAVADLAEHGVGREAALAAAHVGHDAERAELVAAAHHGDPGAHRARDARAAAGRRRSRRGRAGRRSSHASPARRIVRIAVVASR